MAHKDSNWPKIETAKVIKKYDNDLLCDFFNSGERKALNKSGFFEIKYYNPKDIIIQLLGLLESVSNENKKLI